MSKHPDRQFRIRGAATTRLETFFDAAFAFSITMLVISVGTIPENYSELILAIKKVPAFAASFAGITWFWMGHRKWSRWFGLEDNMSIFLTLILIFFMLIYIYPLRLIFSAMFSWFTSGWLPSEFTLAQQFELTDLFVFYGLGFFIMRNHRHIICSFLQVKRSTWIK
ncbi:MAG: TMEM175 family protein [Bacteroidales bacterium]